ncbi:MAG: hypothetical protein OEU95_01620 [Nitrospirota bacterium]|nr:hypothetical protein [Nitrospirota bacterium]
MRTTLSALLVSLLLMIAVPSGAFAEWVFQISTGSAKSFPVPLEIKQHGYEDINITADYETKAWDTFAYYYDLRIGKWKGDSAWEFESLHHKLHLSNRPPEVERFVISHGYNLNTINRAWRINGFIYRLGAGLVMTHPETVVRGGMYDNEGGINGFHLSGVTAQAAVEKRFPISDKIFFSLEGKLTASYAGIPVDNGWATVPNAALHGIFGLGYIF